MIRGRNIIAGAIVAAAAGALWWSQNRWAASETTVHRERAQLEATAGEVAEAMQLEARGEHVGLSERPPQDVIAQVNRVLAEAGLSGNHFQRLTAEGEVAAGQADGSGRESYRMQSVRLILQGMTPGDLGVFLSIWSASQPAWSPTRLELARRRARGTEPGRYDVTIVLCALYASGVPEP